MEGLNVCAWVSIYERRSSTFRTRTLHSNHAAVLDTPVNTACEHLSSTANPETDNADAMQNSTSNNKKTKEKKETRSLSSESETLKEMF